MIMSSNGITSIWSFKNNFLDVVFNNFESINLVSNYSVNEMNLNFDYMHVSSSNEALNTEGILNDEHLINEEDEAKIKPIENETIKINLGTLKNYKEVKLVQHYHQTNKKSSLSFSKNFQKYLHGHSKICLGLTLILCNTEY